MSLEASLSFLQKLQYLLLKRAPLFFVTTKTNYIHKILAMDTASGQASGVIKAIFYIK